MTELYALGIGFGSKDQKGEWLEVFYPSPLLNPKNEVIHALISQTGLDISKGDALAELTSNDLDSLISALNDAGETELTHALSMMKSTKNGNSAALVCALKQDAPPSSVPAAYLKLQLLSHRLVKPHGTDLTGIFGVLRNLAWTNEGAIDLEELPARQLQARVNGQALSVNCIDKFPKMTDYVVPSGVRIADTSRVRLGAYIGEGTTIMHEGFVNFNAGTEGPNMIEGRISAGVFVGSGSDFGGGCSAMGTLSGGGNIVISVGKDCLLGANAGIGIPLGDRCTVEAGLYLTAGTKVQILDASSTSTGSMKASDLAGKSDLLFRRNSISGTVECLTNKSVVELNAELHAHN